MGNGSRWSGCRLPSGLSGEALSESRTEGESERKRQMTNLLRVTAATAVLLLTAGAIFLAVPRRHLEQASFQLPGLPLSSAVGHVAGKSKPDAQALLSQLPMIFEPNQGQAASGVKFVAHGQGYGLYLDDAGAMLALPIPSSGAGQPKLTLEAVRMRLVGANPSPQITGADQLPGTSNYFIGNDPKKWHRGIPQFSKVRYRSVYPGIDLVFYGNQGRLEYDFRVAPGADPAQAELQFDGAHKLELIHGDVTLSGGGASVRLQAPVIYQRVGDRQQPVKGRFVLRGANRVGFEVGAYDRSRELVIDPTISYSTYFGGSVPGNATTTLPFVAVNGNGFIYLTGSTTASNLLTEYPVSGPIQDTLNGAQNIFVLELNPTAVGTAQVVYLTYLGGSGTDTAAGIAVDSGGNTYVAGTTSSPNFPTVSGFQSGPVAGSTGTSHVFVSAISGIVPTSPPTAPTLSYSTYLSGSGTDIASGMAIDTNRDVYVTGTTTSLAAGDQKSGFPSTLLPVPFQQAPAPGAPIQFFVTEVNTANIGASSIAYSTYFGGAVGGTSASQVVAIGGGIAVDTSFNVYFSGTTNFYNSQESLSGGGGQTTDFPILNAYQPCLDTPPPTVLTYPVACTAPATTPYPTDAFVAKINVANAKTGAAQLLFSTYLGGTQTDSSTSLTIDSSNVYLTGATNSSDFVIPTGVAPFQLCLNTPQNPVPPATCTAATPTSPTDAYVARFTNPTESTGTGTTTSATVGLSYFSFLGGTANDVGLAVAVDTAQGALLTGYTQSGSVGVSSPTTGFPVTNGALQSVLNGPQNAFFAHINTTTTTGTNSANYSTYFGGNGTDRGTSITVDPSLNTYFAGDTTSTNLQVQGALQTSLAGAVDAFAVKLRPATDLCITCIAPVLSPSSGVVGAGNPITATFTLTNEGPDLATNITVTGELTPGTVATFNPASAGSGTCSTATGNVAVCTIPTLQAGSTSSVVFSVTPTQAGAGAVTATVTFGNNTNPSNAATASFTATNFSISISPSSQTVVAGNTATYSVLISPAVTFGNNVSLSCSSLPVGASCGFTPSSLTFSGPGAEASTLTLTTTERPPVTISSTKWRGLSYAFWVMVPGMALMGLGSSKRRRGRLLGWFALMMVFLFFALQPACSKAKQVEQVTGTPAGSYPLTVTATSGSFTLSAGFSLTVQ